MRWKGLVQFPGGRNYLITLETVRSRMQMIVWKLNELSAVFHQATRLANKYPPAERRDSGKPITVGERSFLTQAKSHQVDLQATNKQNSFQNRPNDTDTDGLSLFIIYLP